MYKYDQQSDANILVKEDVFLCVDKVKRPGGKQGADWYYILHIVDMTGKSSYLRSEIKSDKFLQIEQKEQTLMFQGDSRVDGSVSYFAFYIKEV
jgi:hypothetical protein